MKIAECKAAVSFVGLRQPHDFPHRTGIPERSAEIRVISAQGTRLYLEDAGEMTAAYLRRKEDAKFETAFAKLDC
jgi:hypothetical protein